MPSIKDEYKRYLQTADGILKYKNFKEILYTVDDSLITYFNNNILQKNLPKSNNIHICDIGGADAKRIIKISAFIKSIDNNKSLSLDLIEQSPILCQNALENLLKTTLFAEFKIYNHLYENHLFKSKYDLIFLIHSIFAFKDAESLNRIFRNLSNEGKAIIFSNSEQSLLATLKKSLDNSYIDSRLEIGFIEDLLTKKNVWFDKFQFNTEWSIEERKFKEEIDIILEWLSLGKFNNLSTKQKDRIYSVIMGLARIEKGNYLFTESEVILIIPKF